MNAAALLSQFDSTIVLGGAVGLGYAVGWLQRWLTARRESRRQRDRWQSILRTAAAWRAGDLTVVESTSDAPGAIVAPIVTSQGCVGVLAAELASGGENRDEVRAMAVIFAAQLATVVTPVAAAESGLVDRVAT